MILKNDWLLGYIHTYLGKIIYENMLNREMHQLHTVKIIVKDWSLYSLQCEFLCKFLIVIAMLLYQHNQLISKGISCRVKCKEKIPLQERKYDRHET